MESPLQLRELCYVRTPSGLVVISPEREKLERNKKHREESGPRRLAQGRTNAPGHVKGTGRDWMRAEACWEGAGEKRARDGRCQSHCLAGLWAKCPWVPEGVSVQFKGNEPGASFVTVSMALEKEKRKTLE